MESHEDLMQPINNEIYAGRGPGEVANIMWQIRAKSTTQRPGRIHGPAL